MSRNKSTQAESAASSIAELFARHMRVNTSHRAILQLEDSLKPVLSTPGSSKRHLQQKSERMLVLVGAACGHLNIDPAGVNDGLIDDMKNTVYIMLG